MAPKLSVVPRLSQRTAIKSRVSRHSIRNRRERDFAVFLSDLRNWRTTPKISRANIQRLQRKNEENETTPAGPRQKIRNGRKQISQWQQFSFLKSSKFRWRLVL